MNEQELQEIEGKYCNFKKGCICSDVQNFVNADIPALIQALRDAWGKIEQMKCCWNCKYDDKRVATFCSSCDGNYNKWELLED